MKLSNKSTTTINHAALMAMALVLAGSSASALKIETPSSLVACQPIAINWSDAPQGDVYLSVVKGGDPTSAALVALPKSSSKPDGSGTITWKVSLEAGTEVTFKIVDSTGQDEFSDKVKINPGTDISCIGDDAAPAAPDTSSDSSSSSTSTTSSDARSTNSDASTSSTSTGASDAVNTTSTSTSSAASDSSTGVSSSTSMSASESPVSGSSAVPFPTVSIPGSGAAFQTYFISGAAVLLAGLGAVYMGVA